MALHTLNQPAAHAAKNGLRGASIRACWLALAIAFLWIVPMWNSFWRDEALTVVLAHAASLGGAWHAASLWSQSPLFSGIEWCVRELFGASEAAMRLPSLLAAIAGVFVIFRIGYERLDAEAGLLFAAVYVVLPNVTAEAGDARPYSLALLARLCSMLFLLRWLRSSRWRDIVLWAIFSSVAIYFHYVFVIALAADALYVAVKRYSDDRVRIGVFACAVALCALLLSPAIPHMRMIAHEGTLLSLTWQPSRRELLWAVIPLAVVPAVLSLCIRWKRWRELLRSVDQDLLRYGIVAGVIPTILLFTLSRWSGVDLFLDRYLLPEAAPVCLLWGTVMRAFEPRAIRTVMFAGVLIIGCVNLTGGWHLPNYHPENWRAAAATVSPNEPVILYPGLVETRKAAWLADPKRAGYLAAPLLVYRPDLTPNRVMILPFSCTPETQAQIAERMRKMLAHASGASVVVREQFSGEDWNKWLQGQLAAAGFQIAHARRYSGVGAIEFKR